MSSAAHKSGNVSNFAQGRAARSRFKRYPIINDLSLKAIGSKLQDP